MFATLRRPAWPERRARPAWPERRARPAWPERRGRAALLLAWLSAVLVAVGVGSVGTAHAAAPYCGITWGSLPKAAGTGSQAALTNARTGRHDCFDRVVFDFAGSADGFQVQYVPEVRTDGEGRRLPVRGGAVLRVYIHAHSFDEEGRITYHHVAGDRVADVRNYRTLRDVVYAGSFEGRTTFGVGARARLPFRVFTLAGPGSTSRIVLDVAHRW
jgi:hypothetical protein